MESVWEAVPEYFDDFIRPFYIGTIVSGVPVMEFDTLGDQISVADRVNRTRTPKQPIFPSVRSVEHIPHPINAGDASEDRVTITKWRVCLKEKTW